MGTVTIGIFNVLTLLCFVFFLCRISSAAVEKVEKKPSEGGTKIAFERCQNMHLKTSFSVQQILILPFPSDCCVNKETGGGGIKSETLNTEIKK